MTQGVKILVVDDDPAMRSLLAFRLEHLGYAVDGAESGEKVQKLLQGEFPYALVVLDMMLPGINGMEVLRQIKQEYALCQVVMITGFPTMKLGIEAIKSGAFDFICKPFDLDQLLKILENALENQKLKKENQQLRQTLKAPTGVSDLVGKSPVMQEIRALIRQAANSRANVLITGQSGTGKEIVAQTIHQNSVLHRGPFISVNCGAIPHHLVESELFGYEKGAFTGANQQTKGKFEQAQNGTIFLDEIGELPLSSQVKLLRVLQEKEIVRLGGQETLKLNLRMMAATNRNLQIAVQEGRFREDLFYRLALFLIDLPPLGARGHDLLLLARHFLQKYTELEGLPTMKLEESAEQALLSSSWPGNVRQLENVIYRSVLMNPGKTSLKASDLKLLPSLASSVSESSSLFSGKILPFPELERRAITEALQITEGNIREAARQLKIARATFYRKLHEYQLTPWVHQRAEEVDWQEES